MKLNKRIGLWLVLLLGTSTITCKNADTSEGIQFSQLAFNDALKEASTSKKLIFMDAYAAWCGPCKMMASRVFTDTEVGSYFNENFVNLKIDMEKGEGPGLSQKYGVTAYPTLYILNAKGEVLFKNVGYMDAAKLLTFGKKAVHAMQ
jgi:thiol:disulfide interchange protein